jgi:signal peptide peptidase SppA
MKYARTSSQFFNTPLALLPSKAEELRAFWESKLAGTSIDFDEKQEPFAVQLLEMDDWYANGGGDEPQAAASAPLAGGGQIAVIPFHGVVAQRLNLMQSMSGGTSTEMFGKALQEQVNNPQVKAIVIDCDSPGGSVYGTDELASQIFAARGTKPIVAVCNSLMASAAYYALSQADEVVITPGGELGSIGVIAMHIDQSEYNAQEGIKPTIIIFGKYKAEGNPHQPLNEEALAEIQAQVDRYGNMFLKAVARGRDVSVETVRTKFGQGRVFGAQQAVSLGMADRVATLDQTIQRFASGGRVSRRGAAAETEPIIIEGDLTPEKVAETETAWEDERERDRLLIDRARFATSR